MQIIYCITETVNSEKDRKHATKSVHHMLHVQYEWYVVFLPFVENAAGS